MDFLHINKNTFDRHENLLLLLLPVVVFLITLATLLSLLNNRHFFSKDKTVAGQKTQALDAK